MTRPLPDRSFGDGTLSRQESQPCGAPYSNDTAGGFTSAESLPTSRRKRAPTVNNDLAYVPTAPKKTPSRRQKDPTPLGFYGTHGSLSGQRYPTFNVGPSLSQASLSPPPVFAAAPSTSGDLDPIARTLLQLSSPHPVYATQVADPIFSATSRKSLSLTMFDSDEVEPRSRTPSPLAAQRQRKYQCNKTHALITGEDIKHYSESDEYPPIGPDDAVDTPETSPGIVTYPAIPRSTSAGLFTPGVYTSTVTQSFPSAQTGNPREPENSPEQAHGVREDWYGHGRNIRSTTDDSVPTRHSSPASGSGLFPPPLPPPLPLPDFIAPRPAIKQRYVSAGGTARLEDRPEIVDFTLPPSVTPGISMTRDLLLQRLESVPQFATPPRSLTIGSPIPIRGSEEALMDYSTRSSYESGQDQQSPKRNRKERSSSQRLARFKRVFSFGKDGKDKDGKEVSPS